MIPTHEDKSKVKVLTMKMRILSQMNCQFTVLQKKLKPFSIRIINSNNLLKWLKVQEVQLSVATRPNPIDNQITPQHLPRVAAPIDPNTYKVRQPAVDLKAMCPQLTRGSWTSISTNTLTQMTQTMMMMKRMRSILLMTKSHLMRAPR